MRKFAPRHVSPHIEAWLRTEIDAFAWSVPYLVPHSNVGPTFLRYASHDLPSVRAYRETLRHLCAILFHQTVFVTPCQLLSKRFAPTPSSTAVESARAINGLLERYGPPYAIRSDNGPSYAAAVTQDLCKFWETDFSFGTPYNSEDQARVERSHVETLRHLRAILFDKRVYDDWSRSIPVVQRVVNSAYNRALGTCPMRMLFGTFITVDRGFLVPWDPDRPVYSNPSEYLQALDSQLHAILEASMAHRDRAYRLARTGPPPVQPRSFAVGDYVLLDYPERPPNKTCFPRGGPFIVTERLGDSYIVLDLLTQRPKRVHVARLHEFRVATNVDPAAVAATEAREFVIDRILEHRYTNDGRPLARNLEFKVRWLGYGPADDTWEPWSGLRNTVAVEDYAQLVKLRLPRTRHDA